MRRAPHARPRFGLGHALAGALWAAALGTSCAFVPGSDPGSETGETEETQATGPESGETAPGEGEATGGTTTGGGGPPPGPLSVATFNVHNFFDRLCQSGQCGPGDFEQLPSAQEFDARVAEIANALRQIDADVVLLQEVENQFCLDALMMALEQDGGSAPYLDAVIGESGFDASIDVAIVSRLPFEDVLYHGSQALPLEGGGTTTFAREFLEVRTWFADRPVSIFNGHFKSKASDDPARRLAEAQRAHGIVTSRAEAIPEGVVLFGGDLNDTPGSPPLEALESDGLLFRPASALADDSTHLFFGEANALDHLFVSTTVSGMSYQAESVEIFRGPVMGFGGSDHAAVRAVVEVLP